MEPAITQLLFRDIRRNDRKTPDKWIQPLRNARFIGKNQFSLHSVRSDVGERLVVVRQYDHKITRIRCRSRVTDKSPVTYTRAILCHGPGDHANAVQSASSVHDSFHRNTPIVEIVGKFHDHPWTCERKEEPSGIARCVLISRLDDLGYFILCVDNALLSECKECRKPDVLP